VLVLPWRRRVESADYVPVDHHVAENHVKRMTFLALASLAVGLVLCVDATPVRAQPPGAPGLQPQSPPTLSPYLNLLRRGNSPTLNYLTLARPQLNFQNSLSNLQQQVGNDQQSIADLEAGVLPMTGHSAMFLNTRGYFQSMRGGAGATQRVQGMPGTTSPNISSGNPNAMTRGGRR
jgi:hypothetical protein